MPKSLLDIVKKKISTAKGRAPDGQTLTGEKSNQVIINPKDVEMKTEETGPSCCTKCKRSGCKVHKETK